MDITKWYTTITIQIPSVADRFNQHTFTISTIEGRLVETNEEVASRAGEIIIAKGKLFTITSLDYNTKIGDFKIISKKACYNKHKVLEFYKYMLK